MPSFVTFSTPRSTAATRSIRKLPSPSTTTHSLVCRWWRTTKSTSLANNLAHPRKHLPTSDQAPVFFITAPFAAGILPNAGTRRTLPCWPWRKQLRMGHRSEMAAGPVLKGLATDQKDLSRNSSLGVCRVGCLWRMPLPQVNQGTGAGGAVIHACRTSEPEQSPHRPTTPSVFCFRHILHYFTNCRAFAIGR